MDSIACRREPSVRYAFARFCAFDFFSICSWIVWWMCRVDRTSGRQCSRSFASAHHTPSSSKYFAIKYFVLCFCLFVCFFNSMFNILKNRIDRCGLGFIWNVPKLSRKITAKSTSECKQNLFLFEKNKNSKISLKKKTIGCFMAVEKMRHRLSFVKDSIIVLLIWTAHWVPECTLLHRRRLRCRICLATAMVSVQCFSYAKQKNKKHFFCFFFGFLVFGSKYWL